MKGGRSVEDINVLWNTSPWKDWHWYALADSCSDSKALSTSFAKTQYKISHRRASFNENSYRKLSEKKQIRKNHIVNCRQTSAVCINVFPHHTHTHTLIQADLNSISQAKISFAAISRKTGRQGFLFSVLYKNAAIKAICKFCKQLQKSVFYQECIV